MTSMTCGLLCMLSDACACSGVLDILGVLAAFVAFVLSLVAIFTGFFSLKTEGRGFGIAGLITGFLSLILKLMIVSGVLFLGFARFKMGMMR